MHNLNLSLEHVHKLSQALLSSISVNACNSDNSKSRNPVALNKDPHLKKAIGPVQSVVRAEELRIFIQETYLKNLALIHIHSQQSRLQLLS